MLQKIKSVGLSLALLASVVVPLVAVTPALAADTPTNNGPYCNYDSSGKPVPCDPLPDCAVSGASNKCGGSCGDIKRCDLINDYINPAINLISILIGVAVVISLTIGGIQYGSSGGDSQKVTAAKNRIRNSLLALVTFLFLYAMLNFLIPGGLV